MFQRAFMLQISLPILRFLSCTARRSFRPKTIDERYYRSNAAGSFKFLLALAISLFSPRNGGDQREGEINNRIPLEGVFQSEHPNDVRTQAFLPIEWQLHSGVEEEGSQWVPFSS